MTKEGNKEENGTENRFFRVKGAREGRLCFKY